ncbi:hypothetical protein B0H14DRAFT_2903803 [Mycena olivaceomarginata]|nr:hypothetical protein B0H14DRAFT_2903803 [Mycena olivaceomarginata]
MKRGFLNGSKANARPLGPVPSASNSLAVAKPATFPPNESTKHMNFSIDKVGAVDVPEGKALQFKERDPYSGSVEGAMTYTTYPIGAEDDEPVTECLLFPGSKEVLLGLGFPKPLVHPATPAFRLVPVPGKRMGLVSTRALKFGELILCERPLLVSARGIYTTAHPNYTREMQLQHTCAFAVDRMRPEDKAAFMELANSHTKDGSGPIVGIIRTNSVGIDGLRPGVKDEMGMYSSVYKNTSRLNHSCSPNTAPHFDMASFSSSLYAVRDIAAGEELTFQYVPTGTSAAKRNKALRPYDFVCTCSACTDAPASDARRAAIKAFIPNVTLWAAVDRTLPDDSLINKCLEQLELITTEGMEHHHSYALATKALMETYICLGDVLNASKWAGKLHKQVWREKTDLASMMGDSTPCNEPDVGKLLDPANTAAYEAHPFWRMRVDPGSNVVARTMQQMAALTGPNNIKTLEGGLTFMMF